MDMWVFRVEVPLCRQKQEVKAIPRLSARPFEGTCTGTTTTARRYPHISTKSGHSSHQSVNTISEEHQMLGFNVGAIRFEGGRRPVVVELFCFLSQGFVLVLVVVLEFGGSGPWLW
jgi:hypothetical protein